MAPLMQSRVGSIRNCKIALHDEATKAFTAPVMTYYTASRCAAELGVLTWRRLQGHALIVVDIGDPKQAHDIEVVRLGLLRQVGRLVEAPQH